jgi:hypothetical protein
LSDTGTKAKLGVHVGSMLMYAAATYDNLLKTAIEAVQNALDARAHNVFVGFDLRDRFAAIADDGSGVSPEKFADALLTVGFSQKERDKSALGKFGLGLISPLDKCQFFEFISRVGNQGQIHAWVFAQEKIKACADDSDIDEIRLSDMPSLEKVFQTEAEKIGVEWNTIVRLHEITADRVVSRLTAEKLASQILSRFNDAMLARETTCHLFVRDEQGKVHQQVLRPLKYKGEALEGSPFVIEDAGEAERITVELYRAPRNRGKRRGVIRVSDSRGEVYGIPLKEFLAQVKQDLGYDNEGFSELLSGYFEGLVRAKLDITVKREGFIANQALLDFVIAFDAWYKTIGRAFYEEERDRARDDRWRELTGKSVADVQQVLASNPDFKETIQAIRDMFQGMGGGSPGESQALHFEVAEASNTKRGKGSGGGPRTASGPRKRGAKTGEGSSDEAAPDAAVRKPPNRTSVKEESLGLTVEVTEFQLSNDLWRFDPDAWRLSFNSSNDVWADLDGASAETRHLYHDHWVVQLQKWVFSDFIRMLMLPRDKWEDFANSSRASARFYADTCIKTYKPSHRL